MTDRNYYERAQTGLDVPWGTLGNRQQRTCIHVLTSYPTMSPEVWEQVLQWILERKNGNDSPK